MKLMTLNTHSLVEGNYDEKLSVFIKAVLEEQPDIIALQEVNQSIDADAADTSVLINFTACGTIPVKTDNHAYNVVKRLAEKGILYHWTWLGLKKGYDRFDEGIALLSKSPVIETDVVAVSCINDYNNWKTRKILGLRNEKYPYSWFYSVHLGWWDDKEDPFCEQWKNLHNSLFKKENVWLMGDFNSPAGIENQGYDHILCDGWYDSYQLAEIKDSGETVTGVIDGWRKDKADIKGMRIDHIWCNSKKEILSSSVIFNGKNRPVISDHYGVIIVVKE